MPIRLEAGDILIFPQGDAHIPPSEPGLSTEPMMELYQQPEGTQLPVPIRRATATARKRGSYAAFSVFRGGVAPSSDGCAAAPATARAHARRDDWLDGFFPQVVAECENRRPGGESILARMSELMFVEVVRQYVESLPQAERGWLAGLRDRALWAARSISCMAARRIAGREAMAEEIGLSRSSLAERFSEFVGCPPMRYHQLAHAAGVGLLSSGNTNIAEIAERVGYESEAAFSRAFKRSLGLAPATWRKAQAQRMAIAAE